MREIEPVSIAPQPVKPVEKRLFLIARDRLAYVALTCTMRANVLLEGELDDASISNLSALLKTAAEVLALASKVGVATNDTEIDQDYLLDLKSREASPIEARV